MLLAVVLAGVILLLVVVAFATLPRQHPTIGRLSHETRRRDQRAARLIPARGLDDADTDVESSPGTLATRVTAPEPRRDAVPAPRVPPSVEEVGVTRRQFFNRSILVGLGLGLGAFGASSLAFLWPVAATGGFGGKINVGSTGDAQDAFSKHEPLYNATAKTYMVPYPKQDLPKAKKIAAYTTPIITGMEAGYVALYQRCTHLGCRVPFCDTSQWFECPCHGSKYNRVGEKVGGPTPRGLDRFVFEISGGNIIVDTGNLVLGPPIGTNTTDQAPEGPLCV